MTTMAKVKESKPKAETTGTTAYKFTLSTGKVVILREPKISDSENCAREMGAINQEQLMYGGVKYQKAMVKRLLVSVNEQTLTLTEKENLDAHFTYKEYSQVLKAVSHLTDDAEGNELNPTIVTV